MQQLNFEKILALETKHLNFKSSNLRFESTHQGPLNEMSLVSLVNTA